MRRNTHKQWPDGGEVFDATIEVPVTIRDPDKPIGTHVFTAMARNDAGLRWTAVTIDNGDDAKDALDRITIPQDVLDRIAPTALPRSSIVISDEPLSRETNYRTEFVAVLNNQPQGGFVTRRPTARCPTLRAATTGATTASAPFSSPIGTRRRAIRVRAAAVLSSGATGLVVRRGTTRMGRSVALGHSRPNWAVGVMSSDKLPLLSFSNPAAFRRWLAAQPLNSQGAWLKLAKKGAAKATLNKSDAIDLALAHGWIDGQLGSVDEFYFKSRFTPRKPKSAWSKINCERVKKLIELGQMTQQGLAQVDAAKADGRWEAAYPSQSTATPHADLQAALDGDPCARRVFDTLDSANRYAIIYRVHQAKTAEKREAKIVELMAMLRRGETIHPRRVARGSSS